MSKALNVVNTINEMENSIERKGLFGYCISELEESCGYCEISKDVRNLLLDHPEKYEAYEEMLIAICGCGFDRVLEKMDEEKTWYESL